MIWNQHLLYQIIDVWYHIRKLYLINNEKNEKIKLNHFFYKRRPIDQWFFLFEGVLGVHTVFAILNSTAKTIYNLLRHSLL